MNSNSFNPDWVSPLRDSVAPEALEELSIAIGLTKQALKYLLDGVDEITVEIAGQLANHVGGSQSFWIRRDEQFRHQLAKSVSAGDPAACRIWLRQFPLAEMVSRGWVRKQADIKDQVTEFLSFFNVANPQDLRERYLSGNLAICYRSSQTYSSRPGPLSAWLVKAQKIASTVKLRSFTRLQLKQLLPTIRSLSLIKSPAEFIPLLKRTLNEAGVHYVVLASPSDCAVSGATFFLESGNPIIIQSFRFRSDDHFWFTLFHEIGHILLHEPSARFFDIAENDQLLEDEANEFAQEMAIPTDAQEELRKLTRSKYSIVRFSRSIGISPGLIVGQLQHRGLVSRNHFNFLKIRYQKNLPLDED